MKTPKYWQPRVFGTGCITLPADAQQAQLNEIEQIQIDAQIQGLQDALTIINQTYWQSPLSASPAHVLSAIERQIMELMPKQIK